MVRVGGGWVALDEFLLKNDPCRGKFHFILHQNIHYLYQLIISLYEQLQYNRNTKNYDTNRLIKY